MAEIIKKGKDVIENAPRVSVIIPAYNIAEYITETLDSVFAQTYKNFEAIVINDGSPDTEAFEKILEKYLDKIIYIKQENLGAAVARNAGIEIARGELIAFLDGDDVWLPEFLDSQTNFLDQNGYDMVYANATFLGSVIHKSKTYMKSSPSIGEANFESILESRCNVITSGTIARRQNILDVGMFERDKVRAHDFILWLKLAQSGCRIGYQKKVLLKYRVLIGGLSGNLLQRAERDIDVFRRVLKNIELDDRQRRFVEEHIKTSEADLEIVRGKFYLLQKKFAAAQDSFQKADAVKNSIRLKVIIRLTQYAPRLLLKIFSMRRADEISFMPQATE